MRLTRSTRLGDLLEAHPNARDVFLDNDIELDDIDPESPLSSIARRNDVDIEELLAELREEIGDDEDGDLDSYGFGGDDDDDDDDYDDDDYDDDDDYEDDDEGGDDLDELGDDLGDDDYDDDYDEEED